MKNPSDGATSTDNWQPDPYARFAAERRMPFDELVAMCAPLDGGVAYDLGCGPGSLTAELPDRLEALRVIGTDTSAAMLEKAYLLANDRLQFAQGDLRQLAADVPADLIFSNAALQWVTGHDVVLSHWRSHLNDGGQIAVQVPTNGDHPAYQLIRSLGEELADWFPDGPPTLAPDTVQPPEWYAELLHTLGAVEQKVQLRVFTHLLDATSEVTEWIKGTSLSTYRVALGDERFGDFEREYTKRLLEMVGDQRPYLFTFKRVLMWARF
jgi:trans-aconitate 2-methyltransferase